MTRRFWVETLGCPKNQVDSDKLTGTLLADGMAPADDVADADLVVVNTCAFIEEARTESVDTILGIDEQRRSDSELVVTGCMAERYGSELAEALPEVSAVAPFGVPVTLGSTRKSGVGSGTNGAATDSPNLLVSAELAVPSFDLLELPRLPVSGPWAYVKVAEGCDRACGFCAIPQFRGEQRSRMMASILDEIQQLDVAEVVLVAQDLAAYGRDKRDGSQKGDRQIIPLVKKAAELVERVRLLYLYPSDLTDELIDTVCATGVPYFDLSLQHVSPPLMRAMRRWGSGAVFLDRIEAIRAREPGAAFRSNFIVGYPGETEADHDALLDFVERAQLDWCGFFAYSEEAGTHGATLDDKIAPALTAERLAELRQLQDQITVARRDDLIGSTVEVLVDRVGEGRSYREAPEIDGVITVPDTLAVGSTHQLVVSAAVGPDLVAQMPSNEISLPGEG